MSLLDRVRRVLVVVAHPDDESFGLGAVLVRLVESGVEVSVLCLTRGEASTLHGQNGELGRVRAAEFDAAARVLGIGRTRLLDRRDGHLAQVRLSDLVTDVASMVSAVDPTHLLVFDTGGVTGHPDHDRATEAALSAAATTDLPVLGWAVPVDVASALNAEFGASFLGRTAEEIDDVLSVERTRQWHAIACHASQSADNPVLLRRLALLGDREHLRVLRSPVTEEQ